MVVWCRTELAVLPWMRSWRPRWPWVAAVAVGGHGDEVAMLAFGGCNYFLGRVAATQQWLRLETVAHECSAHFLQIRAIPLHLLRLAQVELLVVARDEAIGDVQKHEARAAHLGQRTHVREDHPVVGRVLQRNEDALVHQPIAFRKV
jgi:hypothetical protein